MKPVIVIVHDAWHVPQHYYLVAERLRAKGFEVNVPCLPTVSEHAGRMSLGDDVKHLQDVVGALADQDHEVIVFVHSYGGSVATEALEDFALQDRKAKGLPGGVVHLVYAAAFMVRPGESGRPADSQGNAAHASIQAFDDGTSFPRVPPNVVFYHDVEDRLAEQSEKLLMHHSYRANTVPLTQAAWRRIPTTYVEGTEDKVIPLQKQRTFIQAARDEGVEVDVRTLETSHSPFLSKPDEVAAIIESVADRYV